MDFIIIALLVLLTIVVVVLLIKTQGGTKTKLPDLNEMLESQRIQQDNIAREQRETLQIQHNRQMDGLREQYEAQMKALELNLQQQKYEYENRYAKQIEKIEEDYRKQSDDIRRETLVQFEALSSKLLKTNSDSLRSSNKEQIEAIVKPLQDNIENFRKVINDAYVNENASRRSLTDQITKLMELNQSIGNEAKNLTSALKGNSKVQGDWGEMILESLLENSGLIKGQTFDVQVTRDENGNVFVDENGNQLRPDVIVYMPDNHNLIIDSKVSLTAFVDYCNEENQDLKQKYQKAHLLSVRKHIDELSAKRYDKIKGSAEYVMMFIPNEGAYITAVQLEPTLWKYAFDKHVVLVSPTHLYSVMSIVSQLWRQDRQNKNALDIAERGGKLYDKVVGFIDEFMKVGDMLTKAQDTYNTSCNRLFKGSGNVVAQSEKLKELGAKASKSMSQKVLDRSELPDDVELVE